LAGSGHCQAINLQITEWLPGRELNLKLSDWASIGEIVSSLAVVVTLVFLIFGIQENTDATRADTYDRNLESLIQLRLQAAQDEGLSTLIGVYMNGDTRELDGVDRTRLLLWVSAMWGVLEKAYFANEYGTMGPAEWERFATQICLSRARVADDTFWAALESLFSEQFRNYVADKCSQ
jgi:hypothetical protein